LTNNRVQYSGSETSTGGQKSLSTVQDFGKVTITTSAGVQTSTMGEESSSSLVGEVAVDIKLNDDGSLKAKIFNESNDPSSSSSENGAYTQGVGLYYSEEFNKTKDSRVLKLFSDPFNRKGSRKRKKDNKVPTKEPPKEAEVNSTTGTIIVKEE
jgi:hypothetical protein